MKETVSTQDGDNGDTNIFSIHVASDQASLLSIGQEAMHFEAHTSHESDSPLPSHESKPSMSRKSTPCSSLEANNASSACSSDSVKIKEVTIIVDDKTEEKWLAVDVDKQQDEQKDASKDLNSFSKPRDRAHAFSTGGTAKAGAQGGDGAHAPIELLVEEGADTRMIADARPCWYCTYLTTSDICEVCGNLRRKETTV